MPSSVMLSSLRRGLLCSVVVVLVACGIGGSLTEAPPDGDRAIGYLESPPSVPPVSSPGGFAADEASGDDPLGVCQKAFAGKEVVDGATLKTVEFAGVVGFHKQRRAAELGKEVDDAQAAKRGVGLTVITRIPSGDEVVTACVFFGKFAFGSPAPGVDGRFEAYALALVRSDGETPGLTIFMTDLPVFPPDERVDGIIEEASLIYDEKAAAYAERLATASPDEPGLLP